MTKTISVKELRMNFPKIKKELDNGVNFVIIYRSKPLAELKPIELYSKPFEDKIAPKKYDFPNSMEEWLENWDKYQIKIPGVKTNEDIVKLIRKDRGYED